MKIYKRRKSAFINGQTAIAAAFTALCVALLVLCHAMKGTRGIMRNLLKKENGADGIDVVYEEDAGDSYEI